jgi:hypothetical protein
MSSKQPDIQDCEVGIRKYVLVSQPSRWRQKGERVVVQSPMLEISKTVSVIPVKRYNGEEQNSVCFIPKEDIEKDTSNVYDKARVSKATSRVNSHGVALFDSSIHDQFAYKRDDRFWICIGANTNGYDQIVPVINLRTFEKGDIGVDRVCWNPKIQGPNQELWTLGGETRKLKQCGAGKYSHWSWVVCQKLDGTSSTTKTVEIPTKEVKMEDRRQLSTSESRYLFEKRKQCMTEGPAGLSESRGCPPLTYIAPNQMFVLPTSPASSAQQLPQSKQASASSKIQAQQQSSHICAWRRIFEHLEMSGRTNGQYRLRNSLIHPQEIAQRHVNTRRSSLLGMETFSEEDSDISDGTSTCYSPRELSPPRADPKANELFGHDLPTLEGSDLCGAALLVEICRKEKENLARLARDQDCLQISAIDPDFYTGRKSVREEYERSKNKLPENLILTARCSLRDPRCIYTCLSTTIHYHCPPEKCTLSKPPLSSDHPTSDQEHPDGHDPNHEHCVSRLGPYPDSAGDCFLANSLRQFQSHICCYWKNEDLASIPLQSKRLYDDRKLLEAKKKHMQIYDRRAWISAQMDAGKGIAIRDCDLGVGGRRFVDDLTRGELDGEVGDLPMLVDSNVSLTDELSVELGLGGGL